MKFNRSVVNYKLKQLLGPNLTSLMLLRLPLDGAVTTPILHHRRWELSLKRSETQIFGTWSLDVRVNKNPNDLGNSLWNNNVIKSQEKRINKKDRFRAVNQAVSQVQ